MNKVFVYGTLKKNKEDDYVAKGRLYSLGPFPGAKFNEDGEFPGQVLEVDDEELKRFDHIEGHPNFYTRKKIIVTHVSGKEEEAWSYEYNGGVTSSSRIDQWTGIVNAWEF